MTPDDLRPLELVWNKANPSGIRWTEDVMSNRPAPYEDLADYFIGTDPSPLARWMNSTRGF